MTLLEQQKVFTYMVGQLIMWAYEHGYELTFGEAYRTPEQAQINALKHVGIANSLHTQRLAVDLNLFKGTSFLVTKEDYKPLGDYWKSLHALNCWGGDFQTVDADHFSTSWNGVK